MCDFKSVGKGNFNFFEYRKSSRDANVKRMPALKKGGMVSSPSLINNQVELQMRHNRIKPMDKRYFCIGKNNYPDHQKTVEFYPEDNNFNYEDMSNKEIEKIKKTKYFN